MQVNQFTRAKADPCLGNEFREALARKAVKLMVICASKYLSRSAMTCVADLLFLFSLFLSTREPCSSLVSRKRLLLQSAAVPALNYHASHSPADSCVAHLISLLKHWSFSIFSSLHSLHSLHSLLTTHNIHSTHHWQLKIFFLQSSSSKRCT